MKNDLTNRINAGYSRMSKGQKRIAAYITDNFDRAAFFTAAKLGEEVGVSESTVVRFATNLGYKGYPEFQKALEAQVQNKLNSVERMESAYGELTQENILSTMLKADEERLRKTAEQIDSNTFEIAVDMIANAKKVYVIGLRSCAPLASFLSFYLKMMRDNVILIETSSDNEIFEQMLRISEKDCMIGISFPRYSLRTLKALEFASDRNAKIITITDNVHSPMNLYSTCNLLACSDMSSIVESMVAPMSVVNALIIALAVKRKREVSKNLELLEKIWDEYQIYGNDELEYVDDAVKMRYTDFGV